MSSVCACGCLPRQIKYLSPSVPCVAATVVSTPAMGNAGSIITEAKSRGNTFFQSKKYRSAVQHYRHALATESGGFVVNFTRS